VGKLTKHLRLLGFDAIFFTGVDDSRMIEIAAQDDRVILTRDTRLMERRVVSSGRVKAVLVKDDRPDVQIRQVIKMLNLGHSFSPFTLCLECNRMLEERSPEEVRERIPPYIRKTQKEFVECPYCHRVYWKGTHWEAMMRKLRDLAQDTKEDS
jgi:uncharacterized protein